MMGGSEGWDMVEDREFWGRTVLPFVLAVARIGEKVARRRKADRAVSFFTKMTWAAIGAHLVIAVEMNYLAGREKRRRIAERERVKD